MQIGRNDSTEIQEPNLIVINSLYMSEKTLKSGHCHERNQSYKNKELLPVVADF